MEISAFDLDNTLINGNSSASFCRYLYSQRAIPLSTVLHSFVYAVRHRYFGMTLSELHQSVFERLLLGKPLETLEKFVEKFVSQQIHDALYMPAFIRLKRAQQLGHYTMILSNAPSFIVEKFAHILGVDAFHATEYDVDENRRFNKIKRILEGRDKAQHIRAMAKKFGTFIDQITTYSDSVLDLEFLQSAGNPIAVNPDKKLRAISVKNQWSII